MSKIDDLIAQYCPNGVEYTELQKAVKSISIPKKIGKKHYKEIGEYPIIDQGQKYIVAYTSDHKAILPDDEYVIFGDHTRTVKFANFAFAQGADGLKVFQPQNESIFTKFLYYVLKNLKISNRGYNRHWSIIKNITIPIPQLAVQEEIIKILDTFTELEAELEAELGARQQQYNYYRDKLLNFDNYPVKYLPLGEVGTFIRGNGLQKKDFTEQGVGCIHYGQIYTHYGTYTNKTKSFVSPDLAGSLKTIEPGDIVIAVTSENLEDVCKCVAWLGKETIVTGGHAMIFKHNEHPKYIAYYFQTKNFFYQKRCFAQGTKVIDISKTNISKIKIPIPPLAVQEEIVAILDKFDALVNDISIGLPAEITARRQQYEHYRNKLLTFKEA
ncbi:MAG: restriction endonuclease subunit S [Rickettsiaceae bacterium]